MKEERPLEGQQRVEPKVFFYVRVASSFSKCAVSRVASRSITTRPSWTGAPAQFHTRSRAAARAALIAASAPSESSARWEISRDTVGSEATAKTSLVLDALEQAVWTRRQCGITKLDDLICHSDAGSQYTSIAFTERLAEAGVAPSVGSVGRQRRRRSPGCSRLS